jgi:hypothetical protein
MAFNNGKGITRSSNQNCLVGLLAGAHDLEVGRQEKAAPIHLSSGKPKTKKNDVTIPGLTTLS